MGRAIVPLTGQFLESALMMPEGMKILGYRDNMMFDSIDIYVESPDLPETPEGTQAPRLPVTFVNVHWDPWLYPVGLDESTPIYEGVASDLREV
jgi:hypothetical protein